ncbi:hypothetical protein ABPG72_014021 [Tetrahymena utriculariae]
MKKYQEKKKILSEFYQKNKNKGRAFIKKQFTILGTPQRSLDRWITLLEQGKSLDRQSGSGRLPKIASSKTIRKLNKSFNHRSGMSQRKFARQVKCSQSYVNYMLKTKTNIRCYKKKKQPLMTELQMINAKSKCSKLYKKYRNVDYILDDESYFTLRNTTLSGNDVFYSDDKQKTPYQVKVKAQAKFEQKILVWIAISPRGISKPFFAESGLAINQDVYREKCIRSKLLPMILDLYIDQRYVFWPDLASSHYAKSVTAFLKQNNIKFVSKDDNPANLPQARPIEDFWAHLKQLVYEGNWEANSLESLQNRIKYCLKKVDLDFIQNLASQTHKRILQISQNGVINSMK